MVPHTQPYDKNMHSSLRPRLLGIYDYSIVQTLVILQSSFNLDFSFHFLAFVYFGIEGNH